MYLVVSMLKKIEPYKSWENSGELFKEQKKMTTSNTTPNVQLE